MERNTAPFAERLPIDGLLLIHPKVFPDGRGYFSETYNKDEWATLLDFHEQFVQDNHSYSHGHVLRGLHAQAGMGKLVQVISGAIYDVAVDVRHGSPTYGRHHGVLLDDKEKRAFWIPDGFLHGFVVTSPTGAHVLYKCTARHDAGAEYGVDAFDAGIGIEWPVAREHCVLSDRDRAHGTLADRRPV